MNIGRSEVVAYRRRALGASGRRENRAMRLRSVGTVWVLALAAVWIAPVGAFGQAPSLEDQLERNRRLQEQLNQQDPGAVARGMVPQITEVSQVGRDPEPGPAQSDPFTLRVEWTEDAGIVSRMEELGSSRDGFCVKWSAKLLTDTVVGRLEDGTPLHGTLRNPQVESDCYDSGDRFKEFDVPGNSNTVRVSVRTRFNSYYSSWSAEVDAGSLAR